ncbi:MAG: flavodoxin-dependent (E)-4-hydroxy-3-methylbut-2-enyl-diphosphate synthase [Planctomycetaceae bacterium]|nr:flavodoxin-dependent (E)-4-hydroxy-3-methylbut-2-enyl-diphosphate synthase [Planctomycetaceae bacterium]
MPTRAIRIGTIFIGGGHPVTLQSMCATKTTDFLATAKMCQLLHEYGASLVRVAVDSPQDAAALAKIRDLTDANLSVDLQENYRLAEAVAPFVDKIRYNPGHLHHVEPNVPWTEKVRVLAEIATRYDCALRIGVNCGSLDPTKKRGVAELPPMVRSALEHADFLDSLQFHRFCVSLKGSDPLAVLDANRTFARLRPDVPLHLGVTEAGMPPEGILKSRLALEPLLAEGIGNTLRVSLTVPNTRKTEEVDAGREILRNVKNGTIISPDQWKPDRLNIVSCPSCARVENEKFVELAEAVREATRFAADWPIKIAVMGCRVNGPGETDDADFGLWCGPNRVNLKRGETLLGSFPYDEIVQELINAIRAAHKSGPRTNQSRARSKR